MAARFYVPGLQPSSGVAELPAGEAHHLVKVLRLDVGVIVGVFDGRGTEWRARVETAGRGGVRVSLLEPVLSRRPSVDLTLVQAVLKGEPMDDVIRDATMLGIAAIQPIVTSRTTVRSAAMVTAVERWRRVALASAKQCGAARLPDIGHVLKFDEWLPESLQDAFLLVEPSVAVAAVTIRQLASAAVPSRAVLLVGPEGGWTEEERERATTAGCTPLSLGPMTLRAASVPLAAGAALLAIWDLPPEGGSHRR
jgi:16S rRNA (uracil1498-N3)-methyltransferase